MTLQVTDWAGDEASDSQSHISRFATVMKSFVIFNSVIADRFGDYHENEVRGFYSRVLQHEIDHLCGSLFVNKIVHSSTDSSDIGHLLLS